MTKSLAGCISKIGDALHAEDVEAIHARAGALYDNGKGLNLRDAAAQAVAEQLAVVRGMLPVQEPAPAVEQVQEVAAPVKADEKTGLPLNPDGTVTVYHHTSAENAAEIRRTGRLRASAEPDVYVTTRRETDTGYGDAAVQINVMPEALNLDDEFPDGRRDFRLSVGPPGGSIAVAFGEQAVYDVREPASNYDIPLDLFPDTIVGPVPATGGGLGDRARRQAAKARNLPAPNALSLRQDAEFPGLYHASTQLVEVGQRELPVKTVRAWADAAAALASLSNYAVEHFDMLITDRAGKPLAVVGAFKGAQSQTSVYPATMLAEALRIEGAAFAWGVHNHPSGVTELSRADENLSDAIHRAFQPSTVVYQGIAAVGRKDGMLRFTARGDAGERYSGVIPEGGATYSVPIVERTITPGPSGAMVDAPTKAKQITAQMAGGNPGIMFLNSQNEVSAWVPLDPAEMRDGLRKDGRYDKLVNSAAKAGAGAAIIANPSGVMPSRVLDNLASALTLADVRVLDVIDTVSMQSAAERGLDPMKTAAVFAQGRTTDQPSTVESAESEIATLFDGDTSSKITVLPTADQLPLSVRALFKNAAGAQAVTIDKSHVYIVADRVPRGTVRAVVMHELGVHVGLKPDDVARFTRQIKQWAKGEGQLADMAAEALKAGDESSSTNKADEPVAYMLQFMVDAGMTPQTAPTPQSRTLLQKFIDAIKAALETMGLTASNITPQDMVDYVYGAAKMALRQGPQSAASQFAAADFQSAWHGTPHRGIDKFSTDKIGTGEGAQAYGWGLYFASKKEVAEYYRKTLTDKPKQNRAQSMMEAMLKNRRAAKITEAEAIAQTKEWARGEKEIRAKYTDEQIEGEIDALASGNLGQLYEVDIPEDDTLLLWDKPLSEQPAKVSEALTNSESLEGSTDVGVKATDLLRNLAQRDAGTEQLFSKLDVPSKRVVLAGVQGVINNRKVRQAVVGLVPIDVVNILAGKQPSSKALLDNPSMLLDLLAANGNDAVAVNVNRADAAIRAIALAARTEGLLVKAEPVRVPQNLAAALRAGKLDQVHGEQIYRMAERELGSAKDASDFLRSVKVVGIKYLDGTSRTAGDGSYNYVIFSGDDAKILSTQFSQAPQTDSGAGPPQALPPAETRARAAQRVIQDQFNRFTVVRDWAIKQGANMTPDSNVWAYEGRMHGRIATRVQDFREKRVEPAIKAIQKAGFTMEQVAEYLHAQHAKERNKQIESIDPVQKAGSGMTTADAAAILSAADPRLAALANDLRKITDDTKAVLLNAGIINKDMTDAWDATYKHYVPLKGEDKPAGTGKGLSAAGKQHRALGHNARSEHIIENMLRDHERAITLAEKNMVGQSLLAMIFEMGNPDIATVGQPEKRKVLTKSTQYEVVDGAGARLTTFDSLNGANAFIATHSQPGLFGSTAGPLTARAVKGDPSVTYMAASMLADNEVNVYVKGSAVRVQLHDALLARAYTKSGVESLNQLLAVGREINTYFSKIYTGYNPEFLFTNMARDWTTGLINVTGQYGAGIATKAAADYPRAFAELLRYGVTGKSTANIDQYRASGGSTGAAYLSDIERIGKDVQGAYDEYNGVIATLKGRGAVAAGRAAARKFVGHALGWLEHINAAGENAMRLAVFEAVRDTKGYTVNDAADAAKNSTVNFNRRGEYGATMGALYLFFNPAIQGTAAMADALVNGKHRGQAIALTGAMGLLAYTLAAVQFGGGDDDDKTWEKIPDSVKDKNIIVRTGKTTYFTLPVPYGYGFFFSLGNAAYDLRKGRDADKVGIRVASNLLEHFSPIGNPLGGDKPGSAGMVELIPGAIGGEMMRNAMRVAANRSSLGGEIVPDSPFDKDKPDSLKLYRTTKGTNYDLVARQLNLMTGGTKSQAGGIDVSPETLKYWTRTLTGGAGAFVADTFDAGRSAAQYVANPNDPDRAALAPERSERPIVRRFAKEETVKDARRVFWNAVEEVKAAQADLTRARKMDDEAAELSLEKQKGEVASLAKYTDHRTKAIKAQRDLVDEVMTDETTSRAYKRARVSGLEKEEAKMYDEYISEFATAKAADKKTAATR